jgi:DnaA regulatory inactivator Hda
MPRPLSEPPAPAQRVLDLGHSPALGRADFLLSASNREASLWVERWPDWPAPVLAVTGPHGCGKSHLAAIWRAEAEALDILPAELDEACVARVVASPRSVAIDNADAAAGQDGYERALFHLYNALKESRHFLLLTGATPPARWPVALPDLKSRLSAAPCVAIAPPDDELLGMLFTKLFADRQVQVPGEVIAYLVPRMERSFAAVHRLTARLDAITLAEKRPITIAVARTALEEDLTA